jgi:hypothetical protein
LFSNFAIVYSLYLSNYNPDTGYLRETSYLRVELSNGKITRRNLFIFIVYTIYIIIINNLL